MVRCVRRRYEKKKMRGSKRFEIIELKSAIVDIGARKMLSCHMLLYAILPFLNIFNIMP